MNELFLKEAIIESEESVKIGGYPSGAIIVKDGEIIARGQSTGIVLHNDPTGHGEIDAIRKAAKLIGPDLSDCVLYTSMESCEMCKAAAYWAGIKKIIYAVDKESLKPEDFELSMPEMIQDNNLKAIALKVINQ